MPPLRLALVGAFTFPAPLGSQRFLAEQAEALRAVGTEVEPFTYAAQGMTLRGLDPRKPRADLALGRRLRAAHAALPFDAVLAHNAEAALVAFSVRRSHGPTVVYVAHTLWGEELASWLPPGLAPAARTAGRRLDRWLAHRADAVLVLSEAGRRALGPAARGPIACIPPGHTPEPAPGEAEVAATCTRHGLEPGAFALYAGNLDHYQSLDVLDGADRLGPGLPIVIATHQARARRLGSVRVIEVSSFAEARCLLFGATVALLPRRSVGGFPLKLLDYMAAGRAIVARRSVADTLAHDVSAWLLADDAGPRALADAIRHLAADPALRARLGRGAREVLAMHHAWPARSAETLALVREARAAAVARRSPLLAR